MRGDLDSIHLIERSLVQSEAIVLARIEEMREHAFVPPTGVGGCHTMWVLGHLAYIEAMVVNQIMLGRPNPLSEWEKVFDGAEVPSDRSVYPSFDEALQMCRSIRAVTRDFLETLVESDLDERSRSAPAGAEDLFGTRRDCLQYCSDHWYMHRGHLAASRRAAGIDRMWY